MAANRAGTEQNGGHAKNRLAWRLTRSRCEPRGNTMNEMDGKNGERREITWEQRAKPAPSSRGMRNGENQIEREQENPCTKTETEWVSRRPQ
jgi:hypothetical protein